MAIKVLLVGGVGKLAVPYDIKRVGATLKKVYGVTDANITVLISTTNVPITATAVVNKFKAMDSTLRPEDTLMLYLTGHGGKGYFVLGEGQRLTGTWLNTTVKLKIFGKVTFFILKKI